MAQSHIGHVALTSNSSTALHTPGETVEIVGSEGLKRYQYVQYESGTAAVAAAAGLVAVYLDGTDFNGYNVTCDLSDTVANLAAGVLQAALTDEYYGWVQTRGYYATVKTNADDDIAAGASVWVVGDGTVDSTAAGTAPTYRPVGWTTAADVDAADTVATMITLD
jgi:hypothetical protein